MAGPWYGSCDDAMLRAFHTGDVRLEVHDMRVPVTSSPEFGAPACIIAGAFAAAKAAAALFALRRVDFDGDRAISIKNYIIDGSVLDIQYSLEYCFGKHTGSFRQNIL